MGVLQSCSKLITEVKRPSSYCNATWIRSWRHNSTGAMGDALIVDLLTDRSDGACPSSAVAVWLCNKISVDDVIWIVKLRGKVALILLEISECAWIDTNTGVPQKFRSFRGRRLKAQLFCDWLYIWVIITRWLFSEWCEFYESHVSKEFCKYMIKCHDGETKRTHPVNDASIPDARC